LTFLGKLQWGREAKPIWPLHSFLFSFFLSIADVFSLLFCRFFSIALFSVHFS
jgi:hypothetical protein